MPQNRNVPTLPQTVQRGLEMLGRYLGMFKKQIDLDVDNKIIQRLLLGRKRVAGLAEPEDDQEKEDISVATDGPNHDHEPSQIKRRL